MRLPERRSSSAGFTLIEMALVLVIIGLIIGAILKGQDLINSARAKRMTAWIRSAETAQWAHLDRKGKFTNASTLVDDMDTLKNATLNLGGNEFTLSFPEQEHNQTIAVNASNTNDNLQTYYESFDTSIDGETSSNSGSVYFSQDNCNSTYGTSWGNATSTDGSLCYNFATSEIK